MWYFSMISNENLTISTNIARKVNQKLFCKNIAIMYSTIYGYNSSLRLWGLIWKNQSGKLLQVMILTLANHLEIDITTRLLLDCLLSCGDITDVDVRLF